MWLHGAVTHGVLGRLDTTALRGPLPQTAAPQRARWRLPQPAVVVSAIVLAGVVLVVAAVAVGTAVRDGAGLIQTMKDPVLLGALGVGAALAAATWLLLTVLVRHGNRRSTRLAAFAAANGFTYHLRRQQVDDLPATGLFVRALCGGRSMWVPDVVVAPRPRHVELGKTSIMRGSSEGSTREWWGYVAVRTAVPMPHVAVLRRRGLRRRVGRFGVLRQLRRDVPELPGHDRRFRVLCPPGYERDVAAIVSPELLDRWAAMGFDVEILDQWLVLFRRAAVVTLSPRTWQELIEMTALLDAHLTAWERHRTVR